MEQGNNKPAADVEVRPFEALVIWHEMDRINQLANVCRGENTDESLCSMLADIDSSIEDLRHDIEKHFFDTSIIAVRIIDFLRDEPRPCKPRKIAFNIFGFKEDGQELNSFTNCIAKILRQLEREGILEKTRNKYNEVVFLPRLKYGVV